MSGEQLSEMKTPRIGPPRETTKVVTFVVLTSYIVILSGFVLAGIFADGRPNKDWFELVKLGFTTMGSALTLILGYYFGQREVLAVKELKEEADQRIQEVEAAGAKNVGEILTVMTRGVTPNQPESIAEAKLRTGKPAPEVEA